MGRVIVKVPWGDGEYVIQLFAAHVGVDNSVIDAFVFEVPNLDTPEIRAFVPFS